MKDSKGTKRIDSETMESAKGDVELVNSINNNSSSDKKKDPQELEDEESPAALPPALERAQARQISRVGAMAIAGIGASTMTTEPDANIDLPTAGADDEENNNDCPAPPSLVAHSSLGTVASTNLEAQVTATLVSDDEYQADLQRAIMRTSVRASKVETVPETTAAANERKYKKLICVGICFGSLMAIILVAVLVYLAMADDPLGEDSDDIGLPGGGYNGPPPANEDALVKFLVDRSFDGGKALERYASPQSKSMKDQTYFHFQYTRSHILFENVLAAFPQESPSVLFRRNFPTSAWMKD